MNEIQSIIESYGTFGLCVIIFFQIMRVETRILKLEFKIDAYDDRLKRLEGFHK